MANAKSEEHVNLCNNIAKLLLCVTQAVVSYEVFRHIGTSEDT